MDLERPPREDGAHPATGPAARDDDAARELDMVDPEDGHPIQERAEGHMGPGLERQEGIDPTLVTSIVFVLLGFTPYVLWESILGIGFFGPIQIPAILAMVGVLFGFIAVLRAVDTEDRRLRNLALASTALGLVRLFVLPFT